MREQREVIGEWGEAQGTLLGEAHALLDRLKGEVDLEGTKRVVSNRENAHWHAAEAVGYLTIGNVPLGAAHLIWADSWRAVAGMTEEDYADVRAKSEAGTAPGPLSAELFKSANQVLGEWCGDFPCDTPGHELEPVSPEDAPEPRGGLADVEARVAAVSKPRRCLGPRNGFHRVLALVARPACARRPK